MNTKGLVVEFVGTFTLIFIGAGAVAIGQGGLMGTALAHGFVVVAFIYQIFRYKTSPFKAGM